MTAPVYVDCSAAMRRLLTPERLALAPGLRIHDGDPAPGAIVEVIGDAERMLNGHTMMDGALMDRVPALKCVVFLGTGASSYIDLAAAEARGIEVRTVQGYGDRSVAEHTIALLFAAARRIAVQDAALRRGTWAPLEGTTLQGRTLGVIGTGGIGREVIRIAAALGMNVVAWARRPEAGDLPCTFLPLDRLLREADVVSLHLALTPQTTGFLGRAELGAMKPGAILVNTARAALVDRDALLDALREGTLGHAALDVFDEEPLPPGSPLTGLDNVTLTPHVGFKTPEAATRLLEEALRLLSR
ncbi:3-phosphoglycerate dehydrogenase [Acuticoccus sediminis]|uniref:3-phosphoglycerate dehydrogenase n=2 Tax=Acuticoccus sediminis TaxID=2184697 RepID=A0A8B2NUW1_9HYPH|nr:3-phosphoglycerate dehydrogenase [Acuticoccus sediminis]